MRYDTADVAVVDDDRVARRILSRFLESVRVQGPSGQERALRVWSTGDGEVFADWVFAEKRTFGAIFIDYMLGPNSRDGRDLTLGLRRAGYDGVICILTAAPVAYNENLRTHLMESGADRVLVKGDEGLRAAVRRVVSDSVASDPVFREAAATAAESQK